MMMPAHEADFYRRREQQERDLADKADDPSIAAIHRELAEHYASLLGSAPTFGVKIDINPIFRFGSESR